MILYKQNESLKKKKNTLYKKKKKKKKECSLSCPTKINEKCLYLTCY